MSINIKEADICLLLKGLNPEKAHGWDDMSVRMTQLCGKALAKPFLNFILFCGTLKNIIFVFF